MHADKCRHNKTLLLIGASVLSQLRWAKQHVYTWLILTPIVLGMSYLSLSELGDNIAVWQPSPSMSLLVAAAFAWSRSIRTGFVADSPAT